jgi:hypothetical protein
VHGPLSLVAPAFKLRDFGPAARPEQAEPWTTTLRDQQPEDAYAAVYKVGSKHLIFIAAKHANRDDSLTFRLIRDAYSAFDVDTVIAEGFPTSRGPNPASILQYAARSGARPDGFVEGGETVPTVLGAQKENAAIWGGEPDDLTVKARILAKGFPAQDLLGFYVLRNIPQWIGERQIEHTGDPRLEPLVVAALTRNRQLLDVPATVLPSYAEWAAWYQALNHRPIGAEFQTEEVGPLADGRFGTNRIAYAVSRERDAYLHELIVAHLSAEETVLVVFGASHLMIHRPALDAVLGRPCYVATSLSAAALKCR